MEAVVCVPGIVAEIVVEPTFTPFNNPSLDPAIRLIVAYLVLLELHENSFSVAFNGSNTTLSRAVSPTPIVISEGMMVIDFTGTEATVTLLLVL